MPDESLRAALEAAYDEQESGATPEPTDSSEDGGPPADAEEPVRNTTPTEESEPGAADKGPQDSDEDRGVKPDKSKAQETKPAPTAEDKAVERAPESWRPTAKEEWKKLPSAAKHEIWKREQEVAHFVQQTSAKRKIADAFVNTVNPYASMIQAENQNPVQFVGTLLQAAQYLRTGPATGKAQFVATLVKNFGINIQDLDAALSGEELPEDPNDKIAQLVEQRLAPVNQLLATIQQTRAQRAAQVDAEVDTEIHTFAQDPKNEFFSVVYTEMADIIELAARQGRSVGMAEAYDRACKLNPEVQKVIAQRNDQKRQASGSVRQRGPSMTQEGNENTSLRDDIERAFSSVANR
jgi:hypothetical protein